MSSVGSLLHVSRAALSSGCPRRLCGSPMMEASKAPGTRGCVEKSDTSSFIRLCDPSVAPRAPYANESGKAKGICPRGSGGCKAWDNQPTPDPPAGELVSTSNIQHRNLNLEL